MLKDVAEDIGMHESTISRATANKYAHTPQGIFELKFFLHLGRQGRQTARTSAPKPSRKRFARWSPARSRSNPLSDQAIAEILRGDQINIARRTVAKYRQALGILPSAQPQTGSAESPSASGRRHHE